MPANRVGEASSNSEAGGCAIRHRDRNWTSMIRYMISPDATMQLAYDDAVIRAEHLHPGFSAFPVRCLLPLLCQAVHRGEMASSAARVRPLGSMGRKRFMNAIEHCVNR
jgi:hypothetical protein